uniref:TELO2-interacting protein 1 homolog isoform X2 n=1 Tax=Oncorhynchus gorbuscha TaxID=8017 RepID=UPI001EAF2E0E|nr:TELO2-interacting protein 1 homolog isoform X2 [Oncorhynchus gorbuscha]
MDPRKPAPASEVLKAAVLWYMDALLHAAYRDVVFKLFEPAMLPGLVAAISLLLALGEQEKSLVALKCLQALTLQCDCSLDHVSVVIPPPVDFEEDIDGPDVKAELPAHIAKEAMERCIHLPTDHRLSLNIQLSWMCWSCVSVLIEKENELLPIAHCCWPDLLLRLTADDPLVALQALRVSHYFHHSGY